MDLTSPVTTLPTVGEVASRKLKSLGVFTVFDLLLHLPFRYEDRSLISPISRLQPGETVTITGQVTSAKNEYTKSHKVIQRVLITDSTGTIPVIWFNQPYLPRSLKPYTHIYLHGKVDVFSGQRTLVSPDYELVSPARPLIHTARIVPIYPETAGLSSKWLRAKIFSILLKLHPDDVAPISLTHLNRVHFPDNLDQTEPARRKLAHDELFLLQLTSLSRRQSWKATKLSHTFSVPYPQIRQFISHLPFILTPSQDQAVDEVLIDLSTPNPMNRLLQGDVGSGKTVVAAIAAYAAHLNSFQTLVLAPTQILAHQHFNTLSTLFQPLDIKVGLITAGSKLKIVNCKLDIVVGTHALLSPKINLDRVGLVVIDEQHRFGVVQRALAASKGESPHILTMTATPIPRTIALALYGDLDVSVISHPPSGRIPVKTWVIPESKRAAAYKWMHDQMAKYASQAFIVCPLIEESNSLISVKAATAEFTKLTQIFTGSRLGLLHGKLKSKDKQDIINKFRAGELDILVSTPVVEVGVDIPQATIMVVEAAERFGLAQLHQLRGRVGRSVQQSYCLLFSNSDTPRLKALETLHSGQQLAEIDLTLRGPGDIFGTAQSGLPRLKIASYSDFDLVSQAKSTAEKILPDVTKYPLLRSLLKEDKITPTIPAN